MKLTQEHIARCVRVAMARENTSRQELADYIGVNVGSVRYYREGKIFDVRRLWKMAQFYGMSLDEFLQIKELKEAQKNGSD